MAAMRAALLSTYELGRQPFGLASAAAWLRSAGATVVMQDLAVCGTDPGPLRDAGFVGVHVPMHTATRLAVPLVRRVRADLPDAHIACFGLYAPMNEEALRAAGADTVLGAEFERDLAAAWAAAAGVPPLPPPPDRRFRVPDRAGLPPLSRYARLRLDGEERVAGHTEATRGCRHRCRHCPVVPVYDGRFVVVEPDVVLADIRAQVAAGARHVTFGDPDFFNGPAHAMRVVRRLHGEFPELTFDVTIKVEHLRRHRGLLEELQACGCVLVTTAVESFDPDVLERFDKGHSTDDFVAVLAELRRIGLAMNPTFVAFTPWTTLPGYLDFLARIAALDLVDTVAPIQYGIRLLIPAGSLLLTLPDVAELAGPFDPATLVHPWAHPDPDVDRLGEEVLAIARAAGDDRRRAFAAVWDAARARIPAGDVRWPVAPPLDEAMPPATVPYLTEPWYC